MQKNILILILVIWMWLGTVSLMVFYGFKFDGKINGLEAKVGGLQRQISDNEEQIDKIKDGMETVTDPGAAGGKTLTSVGTARSKARDARRLSDMRQLVSAQEMYYGENDQYLTSADYPAFIGVYMTTMPVDPQGYGYGTVSNVGDDESFCYFAKLENLNTTATGCTAEAPCGYYTASQAGNFYKTVPPTTLGTTLTSDCAVQK